MEERSRIADGSVDTQESQAILSIIVYIVYLSLACPMDCHRFSTRSLLSSRLEYCPSPILKQDD